VEAQRAALAAAEGRYAEAARTLAQAHAASHEGLTPMGLLEAARAETAAARRRVRGGGGGGVLSAAVASQREALRRLHAQLADLPAPPQLPTGESADDDDDEDDGVVQLEAHVAAAARELTAVQQHARVVAAAARGAVPDAGDAQLATFQQQAAGLARRLEEREEQLAGAQSELRAVGRYLEAEVRGAAGEADDVQSGLVPQLLCPLYRHAYPC
jgi:hypothetical protein